MAVVLVAPENPPADIGAAREALYTAFQFWLWSLGCGAMEDIESELREGRLGTMFQIWLRSRSRIPRSR